MPTARRRNPVPRRRRRDDEDGESSAAGDVEEFSMSEGSAISNAEDDGDIEGSDVSVEDEDASILASAPASTRPGEHTPKDISKSANGAAKPQLFKSTQETKAMLLALKSSNESQQEELDFDTTLKSASNMDAVEETSIKSQTEPVESQAQKDRKMNPEHVKQKNSNPAFVPNRGGFFLHDDRGVGNHPQFGRSFQRGRGRGVNSGYGSR